MDRARRAYMHTENPGATPGGRASRTYAHMGSPGGAPDRALGGAFRSTAPHRKEHRIENTNNKNQSQQERTLALAFCQIEGIGAGSVKKLLGKAGSISEIRKLQAESLTELLGEKKASLLECWDAPKKLEQAKRQAEQWAKKEIFFDFLWETGYPKRLKEISDPPLILYRIGKLPEPEKKMAAIVGARACSSYGKEMAEYFARGLAKEGVGIVSGMARGADGIAQRAAVSAGGYSVAVLGCGVDVCYPEENRALYESLKKKGCILSEYPPGTQPHSRLFPPRNRIISALSDLVLVIEAREKSGTLITVDMALEQGKDVFAVPGRITDTCSRGCNRLIGNGAGIAVSVAQLTQELQGSAPRTDARDVNADKTPRHASPRASTTASAAAASADFPAPAAPSSWPPVRKTIWQALDTTPQSMDEIADILVRREVSLSAQTLMQELVFLELEGAAGSVMGRYYRKTFACND